MDIKVNLLPKAQLCVFDNHNVTCQVFEQIDDSANQPKTTAAGHQMWMTRWTA